MDRNLADLEAAAETKKQAPRFSLAAVAALELYVVDETRPTCLRVTAWVRVLKVFGVLRSDDAQRLRPNNFEVREGGLSGVLVQTKTTGPAKKVQELPLYITKEMYVVEPRWLTTGVQLLEGIEPKERDYLMPRPAADLHTFSGVPASAGELACLNRLVLQDLGTPRARVDGRGQVHWEFGDATLVSALTSQGWSGHSERATLPSLLAAAGVSRADRDPLGRWAPAGSDEYVRTYRAVVRRSAQVLRSTVTHPNLLVNSDEDHLAGEVARYLAKKGYDPAEAAAAGNGFLEASKLFHADLATYSSEEGAAGEVQDPPPARPEEAPVRAQEDEAPVFVIALSNENKVLRLHRKDGCWHSRNLAFKSFELFEGPSVPDHLYTSYCKKCWPEEGPTTATVQDEASDSDDTSDSEEAQ